MLSPLATYEALLNPKARTILARDDTPAVSRVFISEGWSYMDCCFKMAVSF